MRYPCIAVSLSWIGLAACASPAPAPGAVDASFDATRELVLDGRARIGGYLSAHTIRIPRGARVVVDADLQLVATDTLYVDGELVALDRTDRRAGADAPDLSLRAGVAILGRGSIGGGRGLSFDADGDPGADGGAGSSITLRAPKVWMTGVVRGGAGGQGGSGGRGGDGGDVLRIGDAPSAGEFPEYDAPGGTWTGGDGGIGGRGCENFREGGNGGDAGSVGHFAAGAAAKARS